MKFFILWHPTLEHLILPVSFLSPCLFLLSLTYTMQMYVSYSPFPHRFLYPSSISLVAFMSRRLWIGPSLTRTVLYKFWPMIKFLQETFQYCSVQCKPLHSFLLVLDWYHINSFLSGLEFIFLGEGPHLSCTSEVPHTFTVIYIFAGMNIILNNYLKSCQSNTHRASNNTENLTKAYK